MDKYIKFNDIEKMIENSQIISEGEYCGYCTDDISLNKLPIYFEWIPTSEKMPPDEKFVIGFTPVDKGMFIGYHREDWRDPKGKWICLGPMGAPRIVTKKVTHWMWCPEMPEV